MDTSSEFETIAYDLSLDVPDKKVHRTLEETCRLCVRLDFVDLSILAVVLVILIKSFLKEQELIWS